MKYLISKFFAAAYLGGFIRRRNHFARKIVRDSRELEHSTIQCRKNNIDPQFFNQPNELFFKSRIRKVR